MKKVYVAIYNNQIFHFDNWSECKLFITGKKNVRFRSFTDGNEMKLFIDNNVKKEVAYDIEDVLYAYIKGDFTDSLKERGVYSLRLVKNGKILYKINKTVTFNKKDYPELYAVKKAVNIALKLKESRIIIIYSFLGIEMWANGSWKPKCESVGDYLFYLQQVRQDIVIDFLKSKSDSHYQLLSNIDKKGGRNST